MDRFQDETAVEAPCEGAEIARQMLGTDYAVCRQQTVFDVGEHGVRPAERGVSRGGTTGAGDVSFVNETWLLGNNIEATGRRR